MFVAVHVLILSRLRVCSSGTSYNPVHASALQDEPIEGVLVTFHPKQKSTLPISQGAKTGEDRFVTLRRAKARGAGSEICGDLFIALNKLKSWKESEAARLVMKKFDMEDRFKALRQEENRFHCGPQSVNRADALEDNHVRFLSA